MTVRPLIRHSHHANRHISVNCERYRLVDAGLYVVVEHFNGSNWVTPDRKDRNIPIVRTLARRMIY